MLWFLIRSASMRNNKTSTNFVWKKHLIFCGFKFACPFWKGVYSGPSSLELWMEHAFWMLVTTGIHFCKLLYYHITTSTLPASVPQLAAPPTGDQEVADSTPARSATFFRGDWSRNIFYSHSLSSTDSRRAVVNFWLKNVHSTGWLLRGLSLPSKSVVS